MKFVGIADLKNPQDLLKKMLFDMARMRQAKDNQYAAFDFFATAEHMSDWVYPGTAGKSQRTQLRQSQALLRVTSHLANGAKHFVAEAKRHNSVTNIEKQRFTDPGYVEEGYFEDPLIVQLSHEESIEFGGAEINAIELAERVYKWWENKLKGLST